jgi:hypothetical protein
MELDAADTGRIPDLMLLIRLTKTIGPAEIYSAGWLFSPIMHIQKIVKAKTILIRKKVYGVVRNRSSSFLAVLHQIIEVI